MGHYSQILPVILSGGAGSRLWPLSRQAEAKQFLALSGDRTMIQETADRMSGPEFLPPAFICNASHVDQIQTQVPDHGEILVEPEGRNTGPCAMAAAMHVMATDPDALMLLAPADHVIERPDAFREAVLRAAPIAAAGHHVTFGMTPDYPATGFGYIQQGQPIDAGLFQIESFREKPDEATARGWLETGGYHWNSGIFLFKPSLVIEEMLTLANDCANPARKAYVNATRNGAVIALEPQAFARCKPEPIDIALMERTSKGAVLPCDLGWRDIGSFRAYRDLHAAGDDSVIFGDGYSQGSHRSLIDTDGPLVALVGLDNVGVIVRDGRILVVNLDAAQDVKSIVTRLKADQREDML
ncbi:mannose-1-phosphate guanylyltransferase [Algimonas porphyrae]|uniref:Mannose-1-phosphate guanylyltransferase n=1 Tax=Algimonas porphyrae TaxID=1128113 RepID=A0ABQ5UZ83_9PROT|nr:sugar phosphate nucleotidyltransferase [Algimonas porphyrae]GLQ20042.1 mannose-1-phosphate guanylyltransferase [Algimonas porphyrae]